MALKGILAVLGVVFLLTPVVFISGCVEGDSFQSIFSSLIGEGETIVAPKDVLVVDNINVIPEPPISANSNFTLTFQVVNIGEPQEGSKEARDVDVYAYDWGRCTPSSGATDKLYAFQGRTIYPGGGAELVEWEFKAPTNEELGRMTGKCSIRFAVKYKFDAYTTSDISIISTERLIQASRAGEDISVSPLQTQSIGPLKISVDFETSQPVDESLIIPVIIKVRDEGSGMYEKISTGNPLVIDFEGFDVISCNPIDWISVTGSTATSIDDIPLIKGDTPPIRCDLKVSGDVDGIKTINVIAKIIGYEYPLYEEKGVTIKPTYGE